MSVSIRVLAIVVLLVAGTVGGVVWWMGPKLAHMAFLDAQRSEPFVFLDLARFRDAGVHRARYDGPVQELFASEGGVAMAEYALVHLVQGRRSDEWESLTAWHMDRAQDLVQAMTSEPYRLALDSATSHVLKIGSYEVPKEDWRPGIVVWLGASREGALGSPFVNVLERLEASNGRVVWEAAVDSVAQPAHWSDILVIDFEDDHRALGWLRSEEMAIVRDTTNAGLRDLAVAVYARVGGLGLDP